MSGTSLFRRLYWRVLALLVGCLGLLTLVGFYFQGTYTYRAWQADLQEQVDWTARHWPAGVSPADVARDWRATHAALRLTLIAADGRVLGDSHPERTPIDIGATGLARLMGKAPLALEGSPATLVISRGGQPPYPLHGEFLPILLLLVASAALVLWPVTRRVTRTVDDLSRLAREVAEGRFGETLDAGRRHELAGLVASFNGMSRRLLAGEERQRRLIADVSHELRSPLGRLRALAETIGRHPAEAPELLGRVDAEIALMDRLIGDMLEAARFDAGEGAMAMRPVGIAAFAGDAAARLAPRAAQAGVALTLRAEGDGMTVADPDRLLQALGNLSENAIAVTSGRPDARVLLVSRVEASGWTLTVEDNGPGIAAGDLPHVFDRFYRAERHRGHRRSGPGGGVGLGLGIARAIVEAHGGRLELECPAGGGTVARIVLPLSEAPTQFPDKRLEPA
ncbi:MAG TPA: HAMP domain-containing sensor histidine kinase [Azospirillaceae bacterium]|nr:HAMP domain-containing sensor histidine kinase [Azospirillaceae bacterium]